MELSENDFLLIRKRIPLDTPSRFGLERDLGGG